MTDALDFWSRRKARVKQEAEAESRAAEAAAERDRQAALEEKSDEEILAELDLPDPDRMQRGDDFSVFMARAVPDRLRRRALRRLWVSNPTLACLDGLNDYDTDFTDAATRMDVLKTAYQVGRGIVREDLAKAPAAADPAPAGPEDDTAAEAPAEPEASEVLAAAEPAPEAAECASPAEGPPARRRMRFSFEDTSAPAGQTTRTHTA